MRNGRTWLDPVSRPLERLTYRLMGVDPRQGARLEAIHARHAALQPGGLLFTYLILRFQHLLPLNPQGLGPLSAHLAFNTAVSFTTNTNWQSYGGESTMSYFSQMVGLTFHNFVSAATGIAIAAALVRGIARHTAKTIGNFWVDLVRVTYYLLLPDLPRVRGLPRVAGHDSELQALHQSEAGRAVQDLGREEERQGRNGLGADGKAGDGRTDRRRADHRAGPDGVAGRDQDARHEWRRLRQRQRRASASRTRRRFRTFSRCSRSSRSAAG